MKPSIPETGRVFHFSSYIEGVTKSYYATVSEVEPGHVNGDYHIQIVEQHGTGWEAVPRKDWWDDERFFSGPTITISNPAELTQQASPAGVNELLSLVRDATRVEMWCMMLAKEIETELPKAKLWTYSAGQKPNPMLDPAYVAELSAVAEKLSSSLDGLPPPNPPVVEAIRSSLRDLAPRLEMALDQIPLKSDRLRTGLAASVTYAHLHSRSSLMPAIPDDTALVHTIGQSAIPWKQFREQFPGGLPDGALIQIIGQSELPSTWREFCDANRDGLSSSELQELSRDLATSGRAKVGGGAAPTFYLKLFTLPCAKQPAQASAAANPTHTMPPLEPGPSAGPEKTRPRSR